MQPEAHRQHCSTRPARVLVVDDDAFVCRAIACILQEARGAVVRLAGCGDEALPIAAEFQPQVIISDLVMPGLTFPELCNRLRALPGLSRVPIHLLTGTLPETEHLAPLNLAGIMGKPPDPQKLVSAVDAATNARGLPMGA